MTRILLNFKTGVAGNADDTAPGTWNNQSDTAVGTKIADLLDSAGAATGIAFAIGTGSSFSSSSAGANWTSDHQGYAEEAWETVWFCSGDDDTLVFSGFPANQTGTVKFGAWTSVGRDTRIDDQNANTATAVAKAEPPNTVATLNWQADASGVLTLSPIVVSNFSYVQFLDFEYTAAASLVINTAPATLRSVSTNTATISGSTATPTTLNTTVKIDGSTGVSGTVTGVTDNGDSTYDVDFTFARTTARKFDATGYTLYIDVDGENAETAAIPYEPQTGYDYIDIASPDTGTDVYTQYAGGTFVTNDQLVWDASGGLDFSADTNYITPGALTATIYRIAAAGTVDVEDTITFTLGSGAGIISDLVTDMVTDLVTEMVN